MRPKEHEGPIVVCLPESVITEIYHTICPYCRHGKLPRFRKESSEWTHTEMVAADERWTHVTHTACHASDIRQKIDSRSRKTGNWLAVREPDPALTTTAMAVNDLSSRLKTASGHFQAGHFKAAAEQLRLVQEALPQLLRTCPNCGVPLPGFDDD